MNPATVGSPTPDADSFGFLQTVILVDDHADLSGADTLTEQAELTNDDHDKLDVEPVPGLQAPPTAEPPSYDTFLDAKTIIERFAELGLICAVIRPLAGESVKTTVVPAALRSDVVVLDWWLHGDDGETCLDLIKEITAGPDQRNRMRLIVIYTGDRDLVRIARRVSDTLGGEEMAPTIENVVDAGAIHVRVLAKPGTAVDAELETSVVAFQNLPERVVQEFTSIADGLMPRVVLRSLSAIRNNTHRILCRFSGSLDPGYLGHRILLPYPEDAETHVTDLVAHELSSILHDTGVGRGADIAAVAALVDRGHLHVSLKDASVKAAAQAGGLSIDEYALILVRNGIGSSQANLTKSQQRKAHIWSSSVYSSSGENARSAELSFAYLMRCKTRYENPVPRLGLGVFVRDKSSRAYYLCMQPLCDSVRLDGVTAFPLLRLFEDVDRFHFVLRIDDAYRTFKTSLKMSAVRMASFKPNANPPGVVEGVNVQGTPGWTFKTTRGATFEWVGELREGWAHHYANKFADELARVGADDSEWARHYL